MSNEDFKRRTDVWKIGDGKIKQTTMPTADVERELRKATINKMRGFTPDTSDPTVTDVLADLRDLTNPDDQSLS